MTPEQVYDQEIAPLLLRAGQIAERHGIALTCLVQWAEGETGRTETMPHDRWPEARLASLGVRARGNVDALISAIRKDGEKRGHNSIWLRLLEDRTS